MAPKSKSKKSATRKKLSKSLAWTKGFQEIYFEAIESQAHTNALFRKMAAQANGSKNFNVLLFSSEAEVKALSYLIQQYNFKGLVRVSNGLAKEEQRALKDKAKELDLPFGKEWGQLGLPLEEWGQLGWVLGFRSWRFVGLRFDVTLVVEKRIWIWMWGEYHVFKV